MVAPLSQRQVPQCLGYLAPVRWSCHLDCATVLQPRIPALSRQKVHTHSLRASQSRMRCNSLSVIPVYHLCSHHQKNETFRLGHDTTSRPSTAAWRRNHTKYCHKQARETARVKIPKNRGLGACLGRWAADKGKKKENILLTLSRSSFPCDVGSARALCRAKVLPRLVPVPPVLSLSVTGDG